MNVKHITRRDFIKGSGITLGAVVAAGTSAGCAGKSTAATEPEIETPSSVYGNGSDMNQRILVAYATRKGSTVGIAEMVGKSLAERGFSVDVKPVKDNPSPEGYQAMIIGSAVNGGRWLPEAVEYVTNHQQALNQVQVALFCVHIMNLGEDEKSMKNRLAYLNSVRSLVKPIDEAFFAGVGMNPDETSAVVRWVYRTFKIGGEGDCRDWDKVRGWAQSVTL